MSDNFLLTISYSFVSQYYDLRQIAVKDEEFLLFVMIFTYYSTHYRHALVIIDHLSFLSS